MVFLAVVLKPLRKVALVECNCILPLVTTLRGLNHFAGGVLDDAVVLLWSPQPQFLRFTFMTSICAVANHFNTKFSIHAGNLGGFGLPGGP